MDLQTFGMTLKMTCILKFLQTIGYTEYFHALLKQEAQMMLTTGSTRLAVSRGQQTWYHSTCYI